MKRKGRSISNRDNCYGEFFLILGVILSVGKLHKMSKNIYLGTNSGIFICQQNEVISEISKVYNRIKKGLQPGLLYR